MSTALVSFPPSVSSRAFPRFLTLSSFLSLATHAVRAWTSSSSKVTVSMSRPAVDVRRAEMSESSSSASFEVLVAERLEIEAKWTRVRTAWSRTAGEVCLRNCLLTSSHSDSYAYESGGQQEKGTEEGEKGTHCDLTHVEIEVEVDESRNGEDIDHPAGEGLVLREQLGESFDDGAGENGEVLLVLILGLQGASRVSGEQREGKEERSGPSAMYSIC